jgi:putative transcriptional regulator
MEIKVRLKELLIERNLTQKELAKLTGLREATITAIARNTTSAINKEHLVKIMKALNITEITRILKFE